MNLFKYKDVKKELFFSSKPFPNIELNNLWNNKLLEECFKEIENLKHWDGEDYPNFLKWALSKYTINETSGYQTENETYEYLWEKEIKL